MPMKFANIYELLEKLNKYESSDDLTRFGKENFPSAGAGCWRSAFKVEFSNGQTVVLKIARSNGGGIDSVKQEIKIWKDLAENHEKFFARVIAYDIASRPAWIITEYIPCEYHDFDYGMPGHGDIKNMARAYNIADVMNGRNVRKRADGQVVIVDWGGPH